MKYVVVAVGLVWFVSLTFFLNFVVAETQQSKITNMTSNPFVHYAIPTLNPNLLYTRILSPIEQVQAGMPAKDVKCATGLILVIKVEDGSPACVKPDTAQKLVGRGWAKEPVPYVTLDDQSECKGTEVPSSEFKKRIFPVLMMPTNSTATVCVTYKFESGWQSYQNKDLYPRGILDTCCFISMGWNTNHSVSSNKFEVLANPSLFNMTSTYNGSKISVIYKIHAKSDSKGFYDTSVPFDGCLSYPLAVGYDASEVSATKFHADFSIPCFNTIEDVYSVKIVSGMTYKEIQWGGDYP